MSKKSFYLISIIVTILIGVFLNWKFCCTINEQQVQHKIEKPTPKIIKKPILSFGATDVNGNINFSFKDNIKFKKSSIDFSPSLMTNLDTKLGELKEFVVNPNDEKALAITGYYMSDETNNSVFPNIGLARAIKIKNYMASKGIPTRLIDIYAELNDNMAVDNSNTIDNPIKFSVGKSKDYSKLIEKIIKEIKDNPLVLEFDSGKLNANLTSKQRLKIVNISTYLDKINDAQSLIIGHTDNTGSAGSNLVLGKKRAEFIKHFFVRSGIAEHKIKTISKGEAYPIAKNSTEAGRQKNRRAVVNIKEK